MSTTSAARSDTEHDEEPDVEAHIFDGDDLGEPDPEKKRSGATRRPGQRGQGTRPQAEVEARGR